MHRKVNVCKSQSTVYLHGKSPELIFLNSCEGPTRTWTQTTCGAQTPESSLNLSGLFVGVSVCVRSHAK